jgi:hypothetical protein
MSDLDHARQAAHVFRDAYNSDSPSDLPHSHYHRHADGPFHLHSHDHERVVARTWRRHEVAAHHHEHEAK